MFSLTDLSSDYNSFVIAINTSARQSSLSFANLHSLLLSHSSLPSANNLTTFYANSNKVPSIVPLLPYHPNPIIASPTYWTPPSNPTPPYNNNIWPNFIPRTPFNPFSFILLPKPNTKPNVSHYQISTGSLEVCQICSKKVIQ
jgi:hypothetical protein